MTTEQKFWPFETIPPGRQTEQHEQQIRFLETVFREGFRPFLIGAENFRASATDNQ